MKHPFSPSTALVASALVATTCAGILIALDHKVPTGSPAASGSRGDRTALMMSRLDNIPLSFEENRGQTDPRVKLLARAPGYTLFLTQREAVLALTTASLGPPRGRDAFGGAAGTPAPLSAGGAGGRPRRAALRMSFPGANPAPQLVGADRLPGRSSYFRGHDPRNWQRDVSTYRQARYESLYKGIDLVYYGVNAAKGGHLEYDFVVDPGADPRQIRLAFAGAESMKVDATGDLVMTVAGQQLRQTRPFIYQETEGARQQVEGEYVLHGKREIGFRVAGYDRQRPLVIDPVLSYSTFLGGSHSEQDAIVTVDSAGNAYVAGLTMSADFPTTSGVFDTSHNGSTDVFITKVNSTGTGLVYSTFIGGSDSESVWGVGTDGDGNICVAGSTFSTDFPATAGAFDTTHNGNTDVFVTKVNATGSEIIYSTFMGGASGEGATDLTVDASGNAHVVGQTWNSDFPTTAGAFDRTYGGSGDGFVAKFGSGGAVLYSTFLGGGQGDSVNGVAVDSDGNAFLTGGTASFSFPTTSGALDTSFNESGAIDGFVTKLNSAGSGLLYSTFLGGADADVVGKIATDSNGSAYVTGLTWSADFPTANALQGSLRGPADVFVAKVSSTGSSLTYSTYLGGNERDVPRRLAVDASGAAYVCGSTWSPDFPLADALQQDHGGDEDGFVVKLAATGNSLVFATYLHSNPTETLKDDSATGLALDRAGNLYVTGRTHAGFPTTPGAYDLECGGVADAFVMKISFGTPTDTTAPTLTYTNPAPGAAQRTLPVIVGTTADNVDGSGVASIVVSLRRRSDNRYWSGTSWVTTPTLLDVSGTESWYVTSALPAGSNLPEGGYLLLGSVTDNAGNTRAVNSSFTIDRTAPASVRVVKPSEGSSVNALPSVTGTSADNTGGSGIAKVTLRLRRESDGLYWRGSSWGSVVGLGVVGTTSWSKSAGLPSGGHLLEGAYTLFAYATDRAGNIKSTTSTFSVDKTAPTTLTFTNPTDGSTISSLPAVQGTAADNSGGSGLRLVTVRLRRLNDPATTSDDLYWTGSAWTSSVATLATDNVASWSVTSALPSGSSLPTGQYWLYAYAYDRAGNIRSVRIAVTAQ